MTTYRLMDGVSGRPGVGSSGTQPPATVTSTSGAWLLGTQFTVTGQMAWLNGYYFWVASNGDTGPQKFALWNVYGSGTEVLISGSTVTSGTLTASSFNYVPLATPIQLAPGFQYVACTGWTATNGIPVTSSQFDNGQPYAAGIVNGILTGWSATTGTNGYPTPSRLAGQCVFSNVLGADPGAAMPNNGSGSDNLWVDVQISDTAPGGYAGSYRVCPEHVGFRELLERHGEQLHPRHGVHPVAGVHGQQRVVLQPGRGDATPHRDRRLPGVRDIPGGQSNSSPSWSGAAGSGWMSAPLSGSLNASTKYKVVVLNGAGSPAIWNAAIANYWSTGFGASGLTAGPISVYSNATADSSRPGELQPRGDDHVPEHERGTVHLRAGHRGHPGSDPPAACSSRSSRTRCGHTRRWPGLSSSRRRTPSAAATVPSRSAPRTCRPARRSSAPSATARPLAAAATSRSPA